LGVVKKEGIRNTILYYSGIVLGYFTTIILLPKVLHDDQYGLIRVLIPYAAMIAFFYQLGMPNMLVRFFPYLKDKKKAHNSILFFAYSVAAVGFVVFTSVFLIFKKEIIHFYSLKAALLVQYYYVLFPLAISIAVFEILNGYCRAQLKTYFATFLNEVYVRLLILGIGGLYFYHLFNFQTFLYLYVACYMTNPVIMLFYVWRNKMLFLRPSLQVYRSEYRGKMLNYGFFNFFGGATGMLMDKLDFLFIPGLLSLADAGIYGVAALLATAVALPAKALLQILYPLTAEAYKSGDREQLRYLYKTSCDVQLFVGSFMFMIIWVSYDSFFSLIHHQFLLGKYAFLILGIGRLFDMATGINGSLIMNSKHYRWDMLFTVFLVVLTLVNNIVFIPIYGITGAGLATATAVILYNLFKFAFVWKVLKLQPFSIVTLKIVLAIMAMFGIGLLLPSSGSYIFDLMYKSTVICFLYLMCLLYLNITPEISSTVIALYNRGLKIVTKPLRKRG